MNEIPDNTSINVFHLEELRYVRGELEANLRSIYQLERYAIIAVAMIYSFLANMIQSTETVKAKGILNWECFRMVVHDNVLFMLLLWLPPLLMIIMILRLSALWMNMRTNARYVHRIERHLACQRLGGWEHFVDQRRIFGKVNGVTAGLFWGTLLTICTSLAIGLTCDLSLRRAIAIPAAMTLVFIIAILIIQKKYLTYLVESDQP